MSLFQHLIYTPTGSHVSIQKTCSSAPGVDRNRVETWASTCLADEPSAYMSIVNTTTLPTSYYSTHYSLLPQTSK